MLLSPIFNQTSFLDTNGNPLAGGRIYAYEAGSFSVLQTTYSDEAGTVANPNPIILDSSGRLPGNTVIWLQPNTLYNLVLTLANGTTVLKSFDDVSGVPVSSGGGGGGGTSVWVENVATFLSPTAFLIVGNVTAEFAVGNRVRVLQAGPTFVYGTVTTVSFGGGNTTVTITTATAALNASLTRADHSVLIASGATVDAAGVAYNGAFNYTNPQSIGFEVKDLRADLTVEEAQVNRLNTTWVTSGTGANTPFTITPSPAATSLTADSTWSVRFAAAGAGDATLNVSALGAKRLRTYNSSGAIVNATIPAGFVSTVTYDVTNDCYIVQNRIPQALPVPPRGAQVFVSNGTFTCPASVAVVKVTCVGGGGGGGSGSFEGIDPVITWRGGSGGAGGLTYTYLSVTPGSTYAISVGSGGAGAAGSFGASTAGGSSSFSITLASAPGGAGGANGISGNGANGANGLGGTGLVLTGGLNPYGLGGAGSVGEGTGGAGAQGFVYIEW